MKKFVIFFILLLGLIIPTNHYTIDHKADNNQVFVKLDFDDDDFPEFINL